MKYDFKITRKQQAFINAKEDEVLYGGAFSQRVIAAAKPREAQSAGRQSQSEV